MKKKLTLELEFITPAWDDSNIKYLIESIRGAIRRQLSIDEVRLIDIRKVEKSESDIIKS